MVPGLTLSAWRLGEGIRRPLQIMTILTLGHDPLDLVTLGQSLALSEGALRHRGLIAGPPVPPSRRCVWGAEEPPGPQVLPLASCCSR